jgi:hypothetical protein
VIIVTTLLAFALRLYYQYTRPGFLLGVTEYDDGPYFGSAVRLVHGALPYRDFVLVQPPGITLVMSPVALLTYLTGTGPGLAIGRILTVLASTAGVVLIGLLVRHRGALTTLVACGVLAVFDDAVAASHTVLVEPWLVLFCLIGALALFNGDRLTDTAKRLVWGGVAFGVGGAFEGWAIVPVLIIALMLLPRPRRALLFAGGVAAGFIVPALPFLIAAPSQFYKSLITAQIGSRAHAVRVGVWFRLRHFLGLAAALSWPHDFVIAAVLAVIVFVLACYVIFVQVTHEFPAQLDWFAVVTAALVCAMFLWPPQFHYHFTAYLAPFLGLALALPLSRLVAAIQPLAAKRGAGSWLGLPAIGLVAVLLLFAAISQADLESKSPDVIGAVPSAITRVIPPGACVLADQVSVTLVINRFVSDVPGCSQMVDGLGTDLALSNGLKPGTGAGNVPAVAAVWRNAFDHAQYLVLTAGNPRRIPWTPTLQTYLNDHFTKVMRVGHKLTLYARHGMPGA